MRRAEINCQHSERLRYLSHTSIGQLVAEGLSVQPQKCRHKRNWLLVNAGTGMAIVSID